MEEILKTKEIRNNMEEIMEAIRDSEVLKSHWNNYQSKFTYAEDISYEETMKVIIEIIELIMQE